MLGIINSQSQSIKIGKSDLIDIDCIDQSVEIDDTLVSFIDLSRFYRFHRCLSEDTSVLLKMKTDFMLTVNLLTTELQLRVEGSSNVLSLKKKKKSLKNLIFSLKPALKSSSDGRYCPGFLFFPGFHYLDLPPFQNNLSSASSYFPE